MKPNPATDADNPRPSPSKLNEVRLDDPHTIPCSWDVSEMLNGRAPSLHSTQGRKNGSTPAPEPLEAPVPHGRGKKAISELPELDFPGCFFKPY